MAASDAATSAATPATRLKILARIKNPQNNGVSLTPRHAGEKRRGGLCPCEGPCLGDLAARFARVLRRHIARWRPKGAGKAGRRRHPQIRASQKCTRGGSRVGRTPGLPCAAGFNGVLRALPGERCTIAPVALQMADARTRSGRRITASLDAQTPGVRTTRLLRPRTASPECPRACVCSPPASTRPLLRRRVVRVRTMPHGCPPWHHADPRRRCRVHRHPARIS